MRLLLIRHAQSTANVVHALDSLPPGPTLTELGESQALDLAGLLAELPLRAVYASTAIRAQRTAAPIAAKHGLQVEVIEGVQETYLGDLEGSTDAESYATFLAVSTAWLAGELDRPVPGGESARAVIDRFTAAIGALRERHGADELIAIVSHGAATRLVGAHLASNVGTAAAESALLPNCGQILLHTEARAPTGWVCDYWSGLPDTP